MWILRSTPILVLLLAAWPARAQEAAPVAVIEATGETLLTDFLDRMSAATGKTLLFDPKGQRLFNQTIGSGFRHEVPKERLFDAYRAILTGYELMLTPVGPRGHEIYLVLDTRSSNTLVRYKPTYVAHGELEQYGDRDGLIITCAIPIRKIENLTPLRTALSTMATPSGIGRVNEVPGSNTLIVTDLAPVVVAMARLIAEMDVAPEPAARLEHLAVKHADAREMAEVLTRLLAIAPAPPRAPQMHAAAPATPRVLAWEHGNALVISAAPADVERIRVLVERLDTPVASERVTRILALREAGARYVAAVIGSSLEERGTEGGVAVDPATNAVIVTGDKATVEALRELVLALEEICRTL